MKKRTFFFYLIIILLINNITFSKTQSFTYSNKKLGIGFVFPDNWEIYTSKENAHDNFKNSFNDNKNPDESPLFYGMRQDQQIFVRLLYEKYNDSIDNYFKAFYSINQNNISIKSVKKSEKSIILIYSAEANNLKFRFYEAFFKHNDLVFRLGFWSLDLLFNENIKEMQEIIEQIALKDPSKFNQWNNPCKDIEASFVDAKYDFLHIIAEENIQASIKEETKGIFFEVIGKNNKIFLMGSVHLGKPEFYPLTKRIEESFEQSQNIVVEININNDQVADKTKLLLSSALIRDNKTLDMILPKKLYKEIESLLLSFGIPIEKVNRYEPWMLNTILESLQFIKAGYLENYGVERYFLRKVTQDKNIIELETFESQIETLKKVNYQNQLAYTLLFYKAGEIQIEELMKAWKRGDDKKLEEIIFSQNYNRIENMDNLYNTLFYKRNENFFEQILRFLEKDENYFIIVGAGHLVGGKGVVNLLKQKGFEVIKP